MSASTQEHPPGRPFPPVAELVPHDAPMILVDELVEWSPERAHVRARVRAGGPFVVAGRMPATILLEYMAQAIAVAEGMRGRVDGERDIGLLLGTRELEIDMPDMPDMPDSDELAVGDQLDIHVQREFSDDESSLSSYACEVQREGRRLAAAVVNVMLAPRPEVPQ